MGFRFSGASNFRDWSSGYLPVSPIAACSFGDATLSSEPSFAFAPSPKQFWRGVLQVFGFCSLNFGFQSGAGSRNLPENNARCACVSLGESTLKTAMFREAISLSNVELMIANSPLNAHQGMRWGALPFLVSGSSSCLRHREY